MKVLSTELVPGSEDRLGTRITTYAPTSAKLVADGLEMEVEGVACMGHTRIDGRDIAKPFKVVMVADCRIGLTVEVHEWDDERLETRGEGTHEHR